MQEVVTARALLRAAATALAAVASGAAVAAITLGDVEVRSAVGEPLDARISVTAAAGDRLGGACFSLAPDAASALPALPGATLALRRSASGTRLQVLTKEPVVEPAVGLGIAIACPGSDVAAERKEYSILLDPPRVARGAPAAATASPAIATLAAQPGDTLESLARSIFPRDRNARRTYLAAIRADNPALASLSDSEPLPADATVVLPDLRTFMKAAPAPHTEVAAEPAAPRAEAPAPRARAKARVAERAQPAAPAPAALPSAREEAPALAAAESPAPPRAERVPRTTASARASEPRAAFQLKLSAPVVDLAPSRSMNERQREELRARLALLDADDQTAAMLAMRDSIRRLETQVSELQLRLARSAPTMATQPETAPAKPAPQVEVAPPAKAAPAKPEPPTAAKTEPTKPEPVKSTKAETEPVKPEAMAAKPEANAAKPEAAAAKSEPSATAETPAPTPSAAPPAKAEASAPAAADTPPSPAAVHAIPRPTAARPWYESQWMLPGLLAGMALLLALWLLVRRRNAGAVEEEEYYAEPENDGQTVMMGDDEPLPHREPLLPDEEVGTEPDLSMPAPLLATTRIPPEDTAELRRRYIEERFPEIVNGTLVLSDPASVVNAARLMREDHATPRAVELLHLAIEQDPERMALWLALFEVLRLERLRGEYASLAVRFMERFNGTLEWRKVRYVGRELDPDNPLYEDTETALVFDAAAESWLQPAPGAADAALAAELRGGLMAGAAVAERDLVPDPTPALRKSESFNVA